MLFPFNYVPFIGGNSSCLSSKRGDFRVCQIDRRPVQRASTGSAGLSHGRLDVSVTRSEAIESPELNGLFRSLSFVFVRRL